ncbi:hypothetical protein [Chitinophaga polysaccharea]|uniref:hypothetical protein n=1 Tax=Chitinophaga polysaccharea TaxID=1293035 RepID=UPI0011598F8F|nr:hypothetical protein [Chitinophaga polysaccharea]
MTVFKEEINVPDFLLSEIESFPPSLEESTLPYDHNRLILMLREKEIYKVCDATKKDYELLNQYDKQFGKVVSNLVKGIEMEAAFEEYLAIEKQIEQEISGNLYIYARQMALSVKSLYYYKTKRYDIATAVTIECVAMNEYLVRQGLYTLVFRCLEQNKNISRILFRSGDEEAGNALLVRLFDYMLNGGDRDLYGVIFKEPAFFERQAYIREAYAYECFRMIVEDMIRFPGKGGHQANFVPWYLQLDFEVNTTDRQILYNWIYVSRQLWENNYEHYFESLLTFLKEPVSQLYDVLKLQQAIAASKVIKASDHREKGKIIDAINTFITTKLNVPKSLLFKIIDNI